MLLLISSQSACVQEQSRAAAAIISVIRVFMIPRHYSRLPPRAQGENTGIGARVCVQLDFLVDKTKVIE